MSTSKPINRRILIIDDNEKIHKDFRRILVKDESTINLDEEKNALFGSTQSENEFESFEVDSAYQGEEGLEKIRQALIEDRPYALAFVDIRMPPGWDGLETIRRIWQEYPELQVVICTAYSDYSWQQIVEELGKSEKMLILKKPFDNIEVYQIAITLTQKWHFANQAKQKQKELENIIRERTKLMQKTNHELITALEEAEHFEKTRDEFLAKISHEIRNPMNSVIGFANILFEEELTREQQREYVNYIRQSGVNMLQMVNDILDISKVEAGKLEVEAAQFDLNQLLKEIDLMSTLMAKEKGLEFKLTVSDNVPDMIDTDKKRLRQCLINLINNAIKFTETGHVYLNVYLEDTDSEPLLAVEVEDTGIGIAAEKQTMIFEPYSQASPEITNKYGGTGLGLAITKQLVELLGGTISLTSEEGKGSTFSFQIPAILNSNLLTASTDTLKS